MANKPQSNRSTLRDAPILLSHYAILKRSFPFFSKVSVTIRNNMNDNILPTDTQYRWSVGHQILEKL